MSLLSSSLKGTSYLILLQAFSRVLTFTLNQLILRYTTPSIFGFATIQLELLLSSILFLCREGFRISVQRLPVKQDQDRVQEIVNLSYIPVMAGLFVSSFLSWLYIVQAPAESLTIPYFQSTVCIYAFSTMIELLSEPAYNVALHKLLFKTRAACEGVAIIAKCMATVIVSLYGGQKYGALAFALGQLAYASALMTAYRTQMKGSMKSFIPVRLASGTWFDSSLLMLSVSNTAQGLLKHILTEGDKFVISYFNTNEEQGTYGLAANYGGLIARIILQPIEEASRSYFSNLLPQDVEDKSDESRTEASTASSKTENRETAANALVLILRIYMLFSVLLMTFGPPLIDLIMPHLLSAQWSRITPVLSAYCYYIPFLAINGILEAFVSATATPARLRLQGILFIPCSIAFGIAAVGFRNYGGYGLVMANCVNLEFRILFAGLYMIDFFQREARYRDIWPDKTVSLIAAGTAILLRSRYLPDNVLMALTTTIACGIATLGLFISSEYDLIKSLIQSRS